MTMKMFSAAALVPKYVGSMARPIKPMHRAHTMEITTHTTAMMRDWRTSSAERMPRKRTSTCGMPK